MLSFKQLESFRPPISNANSSEIESGRKMYSKPSSFRSKANVFKRNQYLVTETVKDIEDQGQIKIATTNSRNHYIPIISARQTSQKSGENGLRVNGSGTMSFNGTLNKNKKQINEDLKEKPIAQH